MKIGVIGLGTVGYGVVEILTNEKTRLEKELKQDDGEDGWNSGVR